MRDKNIKTILISSIILSLGIALLPLIPAFATTSLEVIYPSLESSSLGTTSTFPYYIEYIYKLLLWISGIIVVLLLVSSGLSYMTSTGNPAKMNDAKKNITASIIGIIIIFSAFLILYVVNPQMTKITISIPKSPIQLVGTATNTKTQEVQTISIPVKGGFNDVKILGLPYGYQNFSPIKLCCSTSIPNLKEIDLFPQEDFQGDTTTIKNCGNTCYTETIGSGKFVWSTTTINKGELEVKYPEFYNTPSLKNKSSLSNFIEYWYKIIVWIAGLIAVLILIGGGISYISSTGNPSQMKNARSIIFAGLTGLIIILGSYLILNIVNPQLGAPKMQNSANLGIWLEDSNGNKFPINNDVTIMPLNFTYPEKICLPTSTNTLLKSQINGLIFFPQENYEGKGQYFSVFDTGCHDIAGLAVKSIKIDWDLPGLYIDIYNDASTVVPFFIQTSQPNMKNVLGDFYNKKWKNISIEDGTDTLYGAIFYKNTDFSFPTSTSEKEGGWIYPGVSHGSGKAYTSITFPMWDYTLEYDNPNYIYKAPKALPRFGSIQLFNRDPRGANNVDVWLYKAGNYMEKDEAGNDLTCPNFCPYEREILLPQDLSPQRFNPAPHKKGCARKVESLRTRGLTILIEPAYFPGSPSDPPAYDVTEQSYPFKKAESFLSDQPDLSQTPIGQCGSRSWRHMFRYIPEPCAQYIMLIPIR